MNRFDSAQIPPHMLESLQRYVSEGRPVGRFLTAVLSNDLQQACVSADDVNIELLPVYVGYLFNKTPSDCWGSYKLVEAWLVQHADRRRLAETP